MSNQIEYALNYREKGKKKTQIFKIDFMSNRCRRDFEEAMSYATEIQIILDRMNELIAENEELAKDKKNKEKILDNKNKISYLLNSIDQEQALNKLQERFEIIKTILIDNGYEGQFLEYDFWDNCTEPADAILFLKACHDKDNNKKKVQD